LPHNEQPLKLVELIAYAGAEMGCLDPNDQLTLQKFVSTHVLIYNGEPLKEVPLDAKVNEFKSNILVVVDEDKLFGFTVPVINGASKTSLFFVVRAGAPFEEFYATVESTALNRFDGIGIKMVSGEEEIKSSSDFGVNLKGQLMGTRTLIGNGTVAIGGEEVKIVIKK